MYTRQLLVLLFASCVLGIASAASFDRPVEDKAKQIWQLLDYLAVDYGKAVDAGEIKSATEYKEMQEFARTAEQQLGELPSRAEQTRLILDASKLGESISKKAPAAAVAQQAHTLASALLAAYPVTVAPSNVPSLHIGGQLYSAQCASCHGIQGHGDGPLAAQLSPPPIPLSDHARARERSVFALQQIISHGVSGTAMPAFTQLTDDERWALAFFASTLSYTDAEREAGAKRWHEASSELPTLSALAQTSEAALAKAVGAKTARETLAYLRSHPEEFANTKTDSIPIAKTKLHESLVAFEKHDGGTASRLALSAYLDGFEPVEPALAAKDDALFNKIEKDMGLYRGAIGSGNAAEARSIEMRLQSLLSQAEDALGSTNEDPMSVFAGALMILLREGVEALLIIVAMIAFLKKAGRQDVLPYVHGGWVAALASGGATWAVATYLVDISGASRELTEGFSALFAAVILLAVGIWMHQKSMAGRWQAYVKEKLTVALNKRSAATMLFSLSFITVYREVFETVLFYAALWTEGNGAYLLAGLGVGVVILAIIALIMLRTSARLPISQFFAASSALVAILAVILTGKGVGALQKAGIFHTTPLSFPRIDLLGIYPSMQTMLAQATILLVIVLSIIFNKRLTRQSDLETGRTARQ
jgi:high-affinity iron transporter